MSTQSLPPDEGELLKQLKLIEERVARLETHVGLARGAEPEKDGAASKEGAEDSQESLEFQLGQNWFAKAGIVILLLGVAFLLTIPFPNLPAAVPSLAGYLLAGLVLMVSGRWRGSYQQISRYLRAGGLLLLYFTTLRLAHFSLRPAVTNPTIEVALLLVVVAINLTVAVRKLSPHLAGIGLVLGFFTALAGEAPYSTFATITAMSAVSAVLYRRYRWDPILILGTLCALLSHALWAMNNPVFGNPPQVVSSPEANLAFVLLYAVIFAAPSLCVARDVEETSIEDAVTLLSGGGTYGLLLLLTMGPFSSHLVAWHLLASLVFLGLATLCWLRRTSKHMTFVYAMLGYLALSVAIIARFKMPHFFVWLCWQSLLVVATAVWFRSKFIVLGNFAIYLAVFLAYLAATGTADAVSLSFGLVALLSARILNWQKDRLQLKTEFMRNAYLASALVMIPYGLYRLVPIGFVSLSWLALAALYYVFSRWLRNRKYRWMALLTIALTILHVFLVDLTRVSPALRVISFLVLGSALLVISMVYSQRRAKSGKPNPRT